MLHVASALQAPALAAAAVAASAAPPAPPPSRPTRRQLLAGGAALPLAAAAALAAGPAAAPQRADALQLAPLGRAEHVGGPKRTGLSAAEVADILDQSPGRAVLHHRRPHARGLCGRLPI
jgi:hypothetical protein